MSFVVDASIGLTWCFTDEATPRTEALRDRVEESGAVAPTLWLLEMANGILLAQKRGRIGQADSRILLNMVGSYPVQLDTSDPRERLRDVIEIARDHSLTPYDAAYLELAVRLGLPLATDDQDLRVAAEATGVGLL